MKKLSLNLIMILFSVFALSFDAMNQNEHKTTGTMANMPEGKIEKAICMLYPTKDSKVTGKVVFTLAGKGIKIVADVEGLTEGSHGFHIHACGDCSADDGSSAGGHFNPGNHKHGAPGDTISHAGDLGNIVADKSGKAHLEYIDYSISFDGPNSIIGRSVIVHKNADDLKSQPAGNAGARVACGVIGIMCK